MSYSYTFLTHQCDARELREWALVGQSRPLRLGVVSYTALRGQLNAPMMTVEEEVLRDERCPRLSEYYMHSRHWLVRAWLHF